MTDEARRRQLRLRCWRRGTREMDLILGPYADARAGELDAGELIALEGLLAENDHDLYAWVSGRGDAPERHAAAVRALRTFHKIW